MPAKFFIQQASKKFRPAATACPRVYGWEVTFRVRASVLMWKTLDGIMALRRVLPDSGFFPIKSGVLLLLRLSEVFNKTPKYRFYFRRAIS